MASAHQTSALTWIGMLSITMMGTALAQDYSPGHQPLELWDADGQANAPTWIGIWLNILLVVFALGLLFVWRRVEARWVVGGFLAMISTAAILTEVLGVPPLSGLFALMHVMFWSPALYVLLKRRPFFERTITICRLVCSHHRSDCIFLYLRYSRLGYLSRPYLGC